MVYSKIQKIPDGWNQQKSKYKDESPIPKL